MKKVSYFLNGKLYLAVTSQKWTSKTLLQLKGPSFQLPKDSGFVASDYEPTAEELEKEVDDAFEKDLIRVDSMQSDEITFSGLGDPLCCLDTITEAARYIKESRHGVPLRLMTFGLVPGKDASDVATNLKQSGIKNISVALIADNPKTYNELVGPIKGRTFNDVMSFIAVGVETGLSISCTAVERPGVNINNLRSLATSLGATSFRTYKYYP